ncbi:TonB-dependent receptor [Ohtaekwangia koreensis]|uniref:Outer membrane cobalamin receptor protein n=1 Tax=Ohtaekwangia koreensis TaxID=688867 RepID=A0A1T5JXT4_9BACT|nr:carboxypeptidase-like regulatory domain-containing protein [Ohtaekwangia koreensis]SKC56008.1 Outer membrane cobalamin receptor protein [Ohtaekwangia koreensis]
MKILYSILLTFIALTGYAQTKISGKVVDERGAGIPLANVILVDTYDGTSSDTEGNFEFTTTETGTKILLVKFVGYKDSQHEVVLEGKPVTVTVQLEEMINELEAVMITAGAFAASDESRRTVFKAVDIATTAGATADIAGALNTLPGTQKVGESGRLFVRGGDGTEAKTFIDGLLVLDAYSPSAPNTPSRGRFLPFMFKGTSFSTGGYSAEYGQALSSALALDSKDKAEMTRTDIGILSVGGDITHTQAWERGSIIGKIQYTNIRPYFGLINQEIDWEKPPVSIEGSGAFRQQVGKDGMLKVYGNFNHANYSIYQHSIDDYNSKFLYDLTNNYRYLNGFYKEALNDNWIVRGGVSYTYQENDAMVDDDNIVETEKGVHAKTVFEGSLSDKVELKTGVELIQRTYNQQFTFDDGSNLTRAFDEVIAAGFAEADIYTSNKFVTRAGARFEYNNLMDQFSVDPRISLAYKTGTSSQVSFAYGKFRQTAKNELVRVNTTLDPEKAEHFILNYQRIENNRTFRIETYYKKYDDLVKYVNNDASILNNAGNGYAKGIELFWRDNRSLRNTDYWISYSFLDTKRDYLNYPYKATPTFASKHNFSAVYKYFVQAINSQLGFTYSYTSGRPYNNPNAGKFNNGKTPVYSDLSFNWSYLPKPYLIVYLSCTNLLGRDNIFGYEYSTEQNANGIYNSRPVRQAAPRFLFLGIFITLSKDKSVNQLPSL